MGAHAKSPFSTLCSARRPRFCLHRADERDSVAKGACRPIVTRKISLTNAEFCSNSVKMGSDELDCIISLLDDNDFKAELKAFRRSYQRLKVRLRNNKLIGHFKQLITLIRRIQQDFPVKLFKIYKEPQSSKSRKAFQLFNNQFIKRIDVISSKALELYCSTQPHFKVGHLVPHYIVLRASLARLLICFKALLVYAADLYLLSSKSSLIGKLNEKRSDDSKLLTFEEIQQILLRNDCKPREDLIEQPVEVIEEISKDQPKSEEIGQLIDRTSMRPMRACKRKK